MHRAGQVVSISSISSSSSCRRKRGKHVSDCCFHNGRPACPQSTKHLAPSSHQAHVSNALKQLLPWPLLPLSPRHHTTALARQLPLKISPNGIEGTNHKILSFHYFCNKNQITNYILALTEHELEFRQIWVIGITHALGRSFASLTLQHVEFLFKFCCFFLQIVAVSVGR